MKILIVDDDVSTRLVARISLESLGDMAVTEVDNGRDCIKMASKEQPDCILLDARMPELDGPATLAELERDPATSRIPVIYMTAMHGVAALDLLNGTSAIGIIQKPFDPTMLPRQVRVLLEAAEGSRS